jgi:hypothetical protein
VQDQILVEVAIMKRARLLMNLGLKTTAQALVDSKPTYTLTDDEKKINYEKIKALKDPADDGSSKKMIPFSIFDEATPTVLE